MTAPYAPPLTLTPALLNRVAAIAEALGRWSACQDALPSPRLRRENRIHTIQASLAIEQNSLSIEQVSALFDGQRVIGPARDIQEVRNAIAAYEALPRWDPSFRHAAWQNVYSSVSEQWRSIWLRSSKRGAYSAMAHPVPGIGRFFRLIPWPASPKTIWSSSALSGSRNWETPMPLLQISRLMESHLNEPILGR